MWIFLKSGFVSVVQHRSEPALLVVRARQRAPLDWMRRELQLYGAPTNAVPVIETPDADYPHRIELSRKDFAILLAGYVNNTIDYTNFKGVVDALASRNLRDGGRTKRYAATLHRVWATVFEMLDERRKVVRT